MSESEGISRRAALLATAGAGAGLGLAASGPSEAAAGRFTASEIILGGIRLHQGDFVTDVLFTKAGAISVVKSKADKNIDRSGFFLTPDALDTATQAGPDIYRKGEAEVRVHRQTGSLGVYWRGRLVLTDAGSAPGAVFSLASESDLFGLGQFRDAMTNYRNRTVYLAQANMDAVNPVLVSPAGFGILWDTGTDTHMTSKGTQVRFTNTAPVTRYHVFLGDDLDGVIATYRRLTGKAPLLGKWAYGFWQSQERYRTQDELTGILDGYRHRNLPIDVMVQDWRYWGGDEYFSGMVWDKTAFPNPKGMCDTVHAANARVIASVWPAFGPASDVFKALDAKGLLFKGPHWGGGRVLDITSPEARDIYWSHVRDGLISVGLDGLWTDGNEPEFMSTGSRYVTARSYADNGVCAAGPIQDNLLTFSYYQTRLFYQKNREYRPDKRPLTLSRKVYAGQQAWNAVNWSGDIFASWTTLNYQITALQQASLSGLPYWTNDIGGFLVSHHFPEKLSDPAYRELYVRWFQWGAFMPVFRAHGTEIRRELWAMGDDGEPAYEALKTALNRRYSLMPYIYGQAARVTFDDEAFVRPLIMDFAHDPQIARHPNQYMFGRDILVGVVSTPLDHAPADTLTFVPNPAVTGIDGPAPEVRFYEGAGFERLVDTRLSDDLKMSWSGDLPFALKAKPYSAHWRGRIIAAETGLHRFRVTGQGVIRFSLDGKLYVAGRGADDGVATKANGGVSFAGHDGDDVYHFDITLTAGKAYGFELTQSQPTPDVVSLWVEWTPPSLAAALRTTPDKTIAVYLPRGHDWHAFGRAGLLRGGQTLKLRPALGDIPLYVRAGAIIPQTPGITYAMQPATTVELHVYAGADGKQLLYDDAGDGHDYETGAYRRWPIHWDNARRRLTLTPAAGNYRRDETVSFAVILYEIDGRTTRATLAATPAETRTLDI